MPFEIPASENTQQCSVEGYGRCIVFNIAKGDCVFFGGNADSIQPDSYYWVDPVGEYRYCVIWVGTQENVQQGVNEKGLEYKTWRDENIAKLTRYFNSRKI